MKKPPPPLLDVSWAVLLWLALLTFHAIWLHVNFDGLHMVVHRIIGLTD